MKRLPLIILLLLLLLPVGANAQMPVDAAIVQVNPPFEGVELIYSSATIFAYNEYGNYRLDVRPGTVPGAPNALLDGVVHNDTVAQVPTRGSLVVANATPLWDELNIGAATHILTSDGNDAAWAAPVVQTSNLLDGVVHADTAVQAATLGSIIVADATPDWNELNIGAAGNVLTVVGGTAAWAAPAAPAGVWANLAETPIIVQGAQYTARPGPVLGSLAEEVQVLVVCRSANGGACWNALSHPTPVADFVTYTWGDDGAGNLEVRIFNDSQIDIQATVFYVDLG